MSMLSVQISNLRIMAARVNDLLPEMEDILRDAANTIDELRARCQELQEREWQTCRMELLPDEPMTSIQPMRCKTCGHKTYAQLASYCPHCGRRIVE